MAAGGVGHGTATYLGARGAGCLNRLVPLVEVKLRRIVNR